MAHAATEIIVQESQQAIRDDPSKNVVDLRFVRTDKADAKRGSRTMDEIPPELRSRLVSKGFQDKDKTSGKLKTDAPTLPNEVMNLMFARCVNEGQTIEQGDIEAAFLNTGLMAREVYLRIPRGGLPAVRGCRALHAGEIVKCKRSVYGFGDAPLQWYSEHRRGIQECKGAPSALSDTLHVVREEPAGRQPGHTCGR